MVYVADTFSYTLAAGTSQLLITEHLTAYMHLTVNVKTSLGAAIPQIQVSMTTTGGALIQSGTSTSSGQCIFISTGNFEVGDTIKIVATDPKLLYISATITVSLLSTAQSEDISMVSQFVLTINVQNLALATLESMQVVLKNFDASIQLGVQMTSQTGIVQFTSSPTSFFGTGDTIKVFITDSKLVYLPFAATETNLIGNTLTKTYSMIKYYNLQVNVKDGATFVENILILIGDGVHVAKNTSNAG